MNAIIINADSTMVSTIEQPRMSVERRVMIYSFVCRSRADAEALAQFWGSSTMQKEHLVAVLINAAESTPAVPIVQLIVAIKRQMESADLSGGPPE